MHMTDGRRDLKEKKFYSLSQYESRTAKIVFRFANLLSFA